MAIELEKAPACCKQSMERLYDILDAGRCLSELLAVAPKLVQPTPRISLVGVLWRLGSGAWSWRKNRKITSKAVEPIIQNRITTVIDLEIVQHARNKESELEKHWTQIRKEFQV